MTVIRLPEHVVNRIAAGEVVERPASVVKELVENAIDAGAHRISIVTANGGKTLIRVADDGGGMSRSDLALAVERHCTSKLAEDLLDIRTLGFRGEALPSIGAVSRLTVSSRLAGGEDAWSVRVDGGKMTGPKPTALAQGTQVDVEDLFLATPARLKFLKGDKAEAAAISEIVKRIAIAFPQIRFSLSGTDRSPIDLPPSDRAGRLAQVIGREFVESALSIEAEREGVRLTGLAGLPAFNRGNALWQYFYVNGRPVRDRLLAGALRGAYADFLARDRHPAVALFIEIEPHEVDVNVHPAKADVRFRDPGLVSGLLVGAIRQAIASAGGTGSSERATALAAAFGRSPGSGGIARSMPYGGRDWRDSPFAPSFPPMHGNAGFGERQVQFEGQMPSSRAPAEDGPANDRHPLGAARAQLHRNYIVAQTETGLVIVDQHAAHERIVYEALKQAMDAGMAAQLLLIPEIVEMPEEDVDRLLAHAEEFGRLGLAFESFGPGAIAVRETPALLGEIDASALMRDLADEVADWEGNGSLRSRLDAIASRMACHGSVRSGRILKPEEMNALLRQIEATPNSGVCNHGRPTFIELKLKDIERLFGR